MVNAAKSFFFFSILLQHQQHSTRPPDMHNNQPVPQEGFTPHPDAMGWNPSSEATDADTLSGVPSSELLAELARRLSVDPPSFPPSAQPNRKRSLSDAIRQDEGEEEASGNSVAEDGLEQREPKRARKAPELGQGEVPSTQPFPYLYSFLCLSAFFSLFLSSFHSFLSLFHFFLSLSLSFSSPPAFSLSLSLLISASLS